MAEEPQDGYETPDFRNAKAPFLSLDDEGSDANPQEDRMALLST